MKISLVVLFLTVLAAVVTGLSLNERNELQRKFKYYFQTVRPTAPENYVSGRNGSFFSIATEITVLSTHVKASNIYVDAVVLFMWTDDRLLLRELTDRVELPDEFNAWTPRTQTSPPATSLSIFLSPATGTLHWYHRVKGDISCNCDTWKHPFQTFDCELAIENIGNEILTVSELRDARPKSQGKQIEIEPAPFPSANVRFYFVNEWYFSILTVFLPSMIVLALVFFAQWKRRKVQVLVSTAALVCLLVMLTSGRTQSGATLLDLWLSGCFLHAAFLLAVDLILPARRVRYSLMMSADRAERPAMNILAKGSGNVPLTLRARVHHPIHYILEYDSTTSLDADSPKKGLRGTLTRLAGKTFGLSREASTSSELVSACTSEIPVQRHVTRATLGQRKRFALLAISASFMAFMFIYLLLIFTID